MTHTSIPCLEEQISFPLSSLQAKDYTLILSHALVAYPVPHLSDEWQQAQKTIQILSQSCICLDLDGITVYLAGHNPATGWKTHRNISSEHLVDLIAQTSVPASLDFVSALETALKDYFERKAAGKTQVNGEMFLVVVDGEPCDRERLIHLIVETTHRLGHPLELAIGLVQVGDDSVSQGFFQALDDDLYLAGAAYDIVHTQKVASLDLSDPFAFLWTVLTD